MSNRLVRVGRYIRRRRSVPHIEFKMRNEKVNPFMLQQGYGGPLGKTSIRPGKQYGQSTVYLEAHMLRLKRDTRKLAIQLKEDHVRDDVIDTIIHESLHAAIAVLGRTPGPPADPLDTEEEKVLKITDEIMHDIRAQPIVYSRRRPRCTR